MKKFLFIDFDGVFNAMHHNPQIHTRTNLTCAGDSYKINYNPEVIQAINEIAAHPEVIVIWLTTWVDGEDETVFDPIGFDRMPFIGKVDYSADWWKWDVVKEWSESQTEPYRLVWIDDDIKHKIRMELNDWGTNIHPHNPVTKFIEQEHVFAISPNSDHGLVIDHLDQIEAFLEIEENK